MLPKISIIIPTYNRETVIGETLISVINQTFREFECLVVDDYSSDTTVNVVSKFADTDNRIKLIINDRNRGACYSRNHGVKLSKADLVCFLDSDDIWDSRYLAKQYQSLLAQSDASVAICKTIRFSGHISNVDKSYGSLDYPFTLARYLDCQIGWSTSSVLWKKSCLQDLGGFSEELDMWQDWELNIRLLAANYQIVRTDKILTYYRHHWNDQQITYSGDPIKRTMNLYRSRVLAFEHIMKNQRLDLNVTSALRNHFHACSLKAKNSKQYYKYIISSTISKYLIIRCCTIRLFSSLNTLFDHFKKTIY